MPLTPAAQRLQDHLATLDLGLYFTDEEINALAATTLNVSEIEAEGPVQSLACVLQGEFPMISAPEEMWIKAAAGMVAKLESLGYALSESADINPTKEGNTN